MIRIPVVTSVAFLLAFTLMGQQPGPPASAKPTTSAKATTKPAPANDIFSGTVTAFLPESITVVRKVPARPDEFRQFVIDKDTRVEGKLKVNARVTVRFKADSGGAVHALRVIVRVDGKAVVGPGRTGTGK